MSNIKCKCKENFSIKIKTGFFQCPKCKELYLRYFDGKSKKFKIVTTNNKGELN